MDKKPFVPPLPRIEPPDEETIEQIKNIDLHEFEKSYAFKKYVKPMLDRAKKQKHDKRVKWWKDNWLQIVTLIVALLTLIATVLFGVIQLLD